MQIKNKILIVFQVESSAPHILQTLNTVKDQLLSQALYPQYIYFASNIPCNGIQTISTNNQHDVLLSDYVKSHEFDFAIFMDPTQEIIENQHWDEILNHIYQFSTFVLSIIINRNQKSTIGSNFIHIPTYKRINIQPVSSTIQKDLDYYSMMFYYLNNYVPWNVYSSFQMIAQPHTPPYSSAPSLRHTPFFKKNHINNYIKIQHGSEKNFLPKTKLIIRKSFLCIQETKYHQTFFLYPMKYYVFFVKFVLKKYRILP